ncbi:LmeA family phospholipid-binding protein [Streptosporangium sandarakinum]|uniref:LmeA family phospholipid-binding protein n=1 Tax=Streptosporangium sandarakinum TaxID=1260955 RepID=UPI003D93EB71
MRKLVAFLIVLLVLVGVLDRVAAAGVEREIATRATAEYDLASPPEVDIKGIPFLTQAISGRYDEVRGATGALEVSGIRLAGVDFTLYGVTAPLRDLVLDGGKAKVRADRVAGTAVVSLDTLNRRAPQGFKVAVDGDALKVDGELTVLGRKVAAEARMRIGVEGDGLRIVPEKVTLAGGIPVPNAEKAISYRIPLRNLPFNLKVTGVNVVPEGLRISGEATDVPLQG